MNEREALRTHLQTLGFDGVRFAAAGPVGEVPLARWLEAGHHGEMAWLARNADKRLDPDKVLAGVRTVVMLTVNYWAATEPGRDGVKWARYSLYQDYHDTVTPALRAAGQWLEQTWGMAPEDYRYYVDTGPVLERRWAEKAGLGFCGKNAMLISPEHGNWTFLAALLLRKELPADLPLPAVEARPGPGALCGKCTRCLEACPTGALVQPGEVDARRCISYLTIENKGAIPEPLRRAIGGRLYGCDICAEVCPWNRFAHEGRRLLLAGRTEVATLTLKEILGLTPETFATVFRKTAIKRIKWRGLLRNACVVAGNLRAYECRAELDRLAQGDDPLVAEHARWALAEWAAE